MKKWLATLLIGIIGSMGYVVVDKTTDERITELEATVASQQAIIESIDKEDKSLDEMEIGDTLPCSLKPGDVWYASTAERVPYDSEENVKVVINECSCKMVQKTKNGLPIFNIIISGTIDETTSYDGKLMQISLKHNDVVDIARRINENEPIGAKISNNKFYYSFSTDLYGYFTISKYTEIEIYKLTISNFLAIEP